MYCILILVRIGICKYIFLCLCKNSRRISKKLERLPLRWVRVGGTSVGLEKREYLTCILFIYYLTFDSEHVSVFFLFLKKGRLTQ